MYEDLLKKNKKALDFIRNKEGLKEDELNIYCQIGRSELYAKTALGIADLMTDFAEKMIREAKSG